MNGLWLELDHYQNIKMICSMDAATLNQIVERDRIFEFLAGLNLEFDRVRVQLLGREKLPSLNEVFAVVRSEENRRQVMLRESATDGSAMAVNKGEGTRPRSGRIEAQTQANGREGLWCTYCKKPRHTSDTCFKLHGKEAILNRSGGGFKNLVARNQVYLSHNEQEEDQPGVKAEADSSSNLTPCNAEEINKLKSFLKSMQDGSCSLTQLEIPGTKDRDEDWCC
ncbi:uncharacterized protein LOC127809557 [Diospyros lotus]|uniref:uncharacterized protein LOC127809557 n=1 Tax=Diospyros lotus TaxID=55363 RepID=UPI002254E2AF|nr:uncharacterized protein LOC127809557 [Diospyros lotus]